MEHERRRYPRHTIDRPIDAYDQHSGERLGRLANLSRDGFMLLCETPLDADSIWALRLIAVSPGQATEDLRLGADCLWYRMDESGRQGWAGFRIIDLADDQAALLERWLATA